MSTDAACALGDDGVIVCWGCVVPGNNRQCSPPPGLYDELYDGLGLHHCAREAATGRVTCWGVPATAPEEVPIAPAVVAVGNERSCAIASPGDDAFCWGSPWWSDHLWVLDPPPGEYVDIAVGSVHGCALDTMGQVRCWGSEWLSPEPGYTEPVPYPDPPFAGPFTGVETANRSTCVQFQDGTWSCWEPVGWSGVPLVPPPVPMVKLSVGNVHACGLTEDGEILCFGLDTGSGELTPPP